MNTKKAFFTLIIILFASQALAQKVKVPREYKTFIYGDSHLPFAFGHLQELQDSSILLLAPIDDITDGNAMKVIPIDQIFKIRTKRKNSSLRGFIYGFVGGFTLTTLTTPETDPKGVIFIFGGLAGLVTGTLGAILGSGKVVFYLDGDQQKYQARKTRLSRYLYPGM